jgi:formylglycine-generating enzyme required for sulfatase activity
VTYVEYAAFLEDGGYQKRQFWGQSGRDWLSAGVTEPALWQEYAGERPNHPVVGVSFYEASAYCRWLSARSKGVEYRLPRAEEWDRAAFGVDAGHNRFLAEWLFDMRVWRLRQLLKGSRSPAAPHVPFRELDELLEPVRQMVEEYRPELNRDGPMPVGVFPRNGRGLCDLVGGVWEWCDTDLVNPDIPPSERSSAVEAPVVVKGGPVHSVFDPARVVLGGHFDAGTRFEHLGFRVSARRLV